MDDLSAARRDAVARLCQAQAAGLISVDRFEERYAHIREATTRGGLEALVTDLGEDATPLPLAGHSPAAVRASADATFVPVPAGEGPVRIPAILGSAARAGRWVVPDHLEVMVMFGELVLDFRDALFTAETVVLDVSVTFGSLKITVPPGTQVANECREILASSSFPRPRRGPAEPNGILLVIQGRLLLADLQIREQEVGPPPTLAERLGLSRKR